jgi:hypothetical protein
LRTDSRIAPNLAVLNKKGRIAAALSHQLISKKVMNVASLMMFATSTMSSKRNRRTM